MSFSIVIPFYNEELNIKNLLNEINTSLKNLYDNFEIILINDASNDKTFEILKSLENQNKKIKLINNSLNIGQSYSIIKGIKVSKFDTIVTLDGDGQNNPIDIPNLLNEYFNSSKICLVAGIRLNRKDKFIKKLSSKIANKFRKFFLNDDCDDTGCSLKVFSKKIFLNFPEFKGLHRYLPALFKGYGCKVVFLPVSHRPRIYGQSNYGTFLRLFSGCYDIIRILKILRKIKNNDSIS